MEFDTLLAGFRTTIPEGEIFVRLVLASVFGAAIGLDRELRDRPAGLRTHMLTATAAATFSVLTLELFYEVTAPGQNGEAVGADPIRIVEAVTSGVAFLAAGAIIHGHGTVHGLTTGAGMWLAGAIGVACGTGHYSIALMAAVLAVLIMTALRLLAVHLAGKSASDEP